MRVCGMKCRGRTLQGAYVEVEARARGKGRRSIRAEHGIEMVLKGKDGEVCCFAKHGMGDCIIGMACLHWTSVLFFPCHRLSSVLGREQSVSPVLCLCLRVLIQSEAGVSMVFLFESVSPGNEWS